MLAVMEARGSISPDMRRAGLDLRAVLLSGGPPVLLLLGSLGRPAAACVVAVLGNDVPLRQWAQDGGWRGVAIAQETASGILISALATLAKSGNARLLLDQALAAIADSGAETRPLAMHDPGVQAPGDGG
jgi:hypothetical protein